MKKNEEVVGYKSLRAFVAVMVVDFFFILAPFTLFLTVSALSWLYGNMLILVYFSAVLFECNVFANNGGCGTRGFIRNN